MVLRLASTAVQHQSPQLQPKQPSLDWCHFVAGLRCHLCWNLQSFQGRVHCRLFCQMHCSILVAMSDGNVSQWCVTGCHGWRWVNQLFFLLCQLRHMEPAMARHVSPQSAPCFSRSKEGGQQRRFLSWSISPVSFRTTFTETCCFMLFLLLYGIQLVDWALGLSLLLSLSGCFCTAFVFVLVFF